MKTIAFLSKTRTFLSDPQTFERYCTLILQQQKTLHFAHPTTFIALKVPMVFSIHAFQFRMSDMSHTTLIVQAHLQYGVVLHVRPCLFLCEGGQGALLGNGVPPMIPPPSPDIQRHTQNLLHLLGVQVLQTHTKGRFSSVELYLSPQEQLRKALSVYTYRNPPKTHTDITFPNILS